jgi:Ulp1 family protease
MKSLTVTYPSKSKHTIDTFLQKQIDHDGADENRSKKRLRKVFSKMIKDNHFSLKIFVPINAHGEHWSLVMIDIDNHQFSHYCSIHSRLEDYRKTKKVITLMGMVINELLPKEKRDMWKNMDNMNVPVQQDKVSCGLFLCIFAKCLYFEETIQCSKSMVSALRNELKKNSVLAKNLVSSPSKNHAGALQVRMNFAASYCRVPSVICVLPQMLKPL